MDSLQHILCFGTSEVPFLMLSSIHIFRPEGQIWDPVRRDICTGWGIAMLLGPEILLCNHEARLLSYNSRHVCICERNIYIKIRNRFPCSLSIYLWKAYIPDKKKKRTQ